MKSLMLSLVMTVAFQAQAAKVELGKYTAVDAETKSIRADLDLRAGGKVTMKADVSGFALSCNGKYTITNNQLNASVVCPGSELVDQTNVTIDVTNVTPESVRTEKGAEVDVVIDAIGTEPTKYLLKKAD